MKGDVTTQSAHGRYRIQTVAELTGVPASTLRAWEQRYGFPAPQRTASAYRLYTDADVARIVRVRALCDGGMAAAEAVAAVMAEAGEVPLVASGLPSSIAPSSIAPSSIAPTSIASTTGAIDIAQIDGVLRSALVIAPAAVALTQTIEPLWTRTRAQWTAGELDRAEHRIVSELLGHAVRDLVRLGQPAGATATALLGGFGDDDDLVPLGRVALSCHARGVRTLLLGGRASVGAVADGVRRWAPKLVALACVEAPPASRARDLLDDLERAAAGARLIVCGPGAAALQAGQRQGVQIVADPEAIAAAVNAACDVV